MPNSVGLQYHPMTPPEMSEGWSVYIDDLMAAQDMLLLPAADSSSLIVPPAAADLSSSNVSDAASCAPPAWNRAATVESPIACRPAHKRARGSRFADDPLEDTASSPLSSRPKVYLNETDRMDIISSKVDARKHATGTGTYTSTQVQDNGGAGIFFASLEELKETRPETVGSRPTPTRGSYERSELRRRGLCLVPVSMLIDYLK